MKDWLSDERKERERLGAEAVAEERKEAAATASELAPAQAPDRRIMTRKGAKRGLEQNPVLL